MDDITLELQAILDDLATSGVRATLDPGMVLPLVTIHGVCALVNPPSQYLNTTHGLMVELTVPVRLITAGPHDMAAVERLNAALVAVWGVLRPIQPVTPEPWDAADSEMPTLMVPAARQITCPMTAPTLAHAN